MLLADAELFREVSAGSPDVLNKRVAELRAKSMQMDRLPIEVHGQTAVVSITGPVYKQRSFWRASWLDLAETFKSLRTNHTVQNVLLKIDSPGGQVAGLAEAYDELVALAAEKPTETFCCGTLASAVYHIACATSTITAQRVDVVGSIGTRMGLFDVSEAFEQMGIQRVEFNTGWAKSLGAMGLPVTDQQRAYLQEFVNQTQEDFRESVQSGRGFTDAQYATIATGQVWLASSAMELGLIDQIGTFDDTLARMMGDNATTATSFQKETTVADEATQTDAADDAADPATQETAGAPAGQQQQPEAVEAQPAAGDPRAECNRFRTAFGDEGAQAWMDGKSFEQAQAEHTQRTNEKLDQVLADNAKLRQQLGAADPDQVGGDAINTPAGDATGGEPKATLSDLLAGGIPADS